MNTAMKISYFWDPETTAVKVGGWKKAEISQKKTTLNWDVSSHVTKAGLYEFTFEYISGKGTVTDVRLAELMAKRTSAIKNNLMNCKLGEVALSFI